MSCLSGCYHNKTEIHGTAKHIVKNSWIPYHSQKYITIPGTIILLSSPILSYYTNNVLLPA